MPPSTNVSSTESSFLEVTEQLFAEAKRIEQDEPELKTLLHRTILSPCGVESFELAVASTVCYRLLLHPCSQNNNQSNGATVADTNMTTTTTPNRSSSMPARMPSNSSAPIFCPDSLRDSIVKAMKDETTLELGHSMREAVLEDVLSVIRRDPATESPLEVILFNKGFAALCCHRAAYRLWKTHNKKYTALFLQSQCSAVFGVDIHPLSQIGCGIMLDHATGVVVGETAVIHDGCSILHGVTLGGTGKDHGDRHPKVGKNVLIGAGSSILGNIRIGDGAKIGAGSVVLRAIPAGATAVGAPAKIIGRASESKPGSDIDETLEHVSLLHKSETVANMSELLKHRPSSAETAPTLATTEESSSSSSSEEEDSNSGSISSNNMCPWREYVRMAKLAPADSVTICTLRKLLLPEGCSHAEIGDCLFELDSKNVGYVHTEVFKKRGVGVIVKYTPLEESRVEQIVTAFFEKYEEEKTRQTLALGSEGAKSSPSVAVH